MTWHFDCSRPFAFHFIVGALTPALMIPLRQHTIKYEDLPTVVDVDIMIRSMGPISESDMVRDND